MYHQILSQSWFPRFVGTKCVREDSNGEGKTTAHKMQPCLQPRTFYFLILPFLKTTKREQFLISTQQFETGRHLMIQQEFSKAFCVTGILIAFIAKVKTNIIC